MLIRSPPQKISHKKNFVPNWITQEILDVYSCISEIRRISKKNSIWMLDNRYILIIHKLNCVNRYGINEPRRISVLIVIPWRACKVRVIKLNDTITSSSNEHVCHNSYPDMLCLRDAMRRWSCIKVCTCVVTVYFSCISRALRSDLKRQRWSYLILWWITENFPRDSKDTQPVKSQGDLLQVNLTS